MNVRLGVRILACVTGLVVVAVLAILVPKALWSPSSQIAVVLLGLSIALPPFVPLPAPKSSIDSDAASVWLIGPMGAWLCVLVVVAIVGLWFALRHVSIGAWAVMVVWAGLCTAGWVSLRASTEIVVRASAQTQRATRDARIQWMATLSALSVDARQADSKQLLDDLVERIRYAANDNANSDSAQTNQINGLLSKLSSALDNSEELNRIIRSIESLLIQREHAIRSTRSLA